MNFIDNLLPRRHHAFNSEPPAPSLVNSLCRQSAKQYASVTLPPRVQELVNKYPYLSALYGAQGMWCIDKFTRSQIPLHSDRLLFCGHIPSRDVFFGDSLEPLPSGLYHGLSGFHWEIDFLTAIGMIYEEDYKSHTRLFRSRYQQLLSEYYETEKDTDPLRTCFTVSKKEIEDALLLIQHERELFQFSGTRIPPMINERHAIIKELIEIVKAKAEAEESYQGTIPDKSDRNSSIYRIGNKWHANIYSPMLSDPIVEGKIIDQIEFDEFYNCGVNDGIIPATKIIRKGTKYALFINDGMLDMTIGTFVCHDVDPFIYDEIHVYGDWNSWVDFGYVTCRQNDVWTLIKVTQYPYQDCEVIQTGLKSNIKALMAVGIENLNEFTSDGALAWKRSR